MKLKTVLWLVLALLGAILLSIAFIDRPLALFVDQQLGAMRSAAGAITTALEWIFAFEVSKYLYAFVFLLVGAALHLPRVERHPRFCVAKPLLMDRLTK